MIMDKMAEVMDQYFSTVTDEQCEKDLIEAGILRCPDKMEVEIVAESLVLPNYQKGMESVWVFKTSLTYQIEPCYALENKSNYIDLREVA